MIPRIVFEEPRQPIGDQLPRLRSFVPVVMLAFRVADLKLVARVANAVRASEELEDGDFAIFAAIVEATGLVINDTFAKHFAGSKLIVEGDRRREQLEAIANVMQQRADAEALSVLIIVDPLDGDDARQTEAVYRSIDSFAKRVAR